MRDKTQRHKTFKYVARKKNTRNKSIFLANTMAKSGVDAPTKRIERKDYRPCNRVSVFHNVKNTQKKEIKRHGAATKKRLTLQ